MTKPVATKTASKPAAPKTAKPAKPDVAANKFVRISNSTYTKLLDLQLARSHKEGRRVSLGEVVSDLVPKKK